MRAVQLPPEEQAAQRLAQRPHLHREDADDAEQEADAHDRIQQRARAGAHLRARRRRSRTARGHASQGRGAEASGRGGARMRLAKQGRNKVFRAAGARKHLAGQGRTRRPHQRTDVAEREIHEHVGLHVVTEEGIPARGTQSVPVAGGARRRA